MVYYDNSITLEPALYFVGISGANGKNFFRQDITAWSFETVNFDSSINYPILGLARSSAFETLGGATWGTPGLILTQFRPDQPGVFLPRTQFPAHKVFRAKFDWNVQNYATGPSSENG